MATQPPGEFDQYAADYDRALAQGLSVSGEGKDYFAQGRVEWLGRCLRRMNFQPRTLLDFGCGTGSSVPFLIEEFQPDSVLGVDVSEKSLEVAAQPGWARARFQSLAKYQPRAGIDLAFCNGVFHHIPVAERAGAVRCVHDALRPGGLFAFWENNPWNPGTRYVMSRIPFDRDAIMLSVLGAKRMLRAGGLEIVRSDFLFIFPASLKALRGLEAPLSCLPLGAQYLVLARRPAA